MLSREQVGFMKIGIISISRKVKTVFMRAFLVKLNPWIREWDEIFLK